METDRLKSLVEITEPEFSFSMEVDMSTVNFRLNEIIYTNVNRGPVKIKFYESNNTLNGEGILCYNPDDKDGAYNYIKDIRTSIPKQEFVDLIISPSVSFKAVIVAIPDFEPDDDQYMTGIDVYNKFAKNYTSGKLLTFQQENNLMSGFGDNVGPSFINPLQLNKLDNLNTWYKRNTLQPISYADNILGLIKFTDSVTSFMLTGTKIYSQFTIHIIGEKYVLHNDFTLGESIWISFQKYTLSGVLYLRIFVSCREGLSENLVLKVNISDLTDYKFNLYGGGGVVPLPLNNNTDKVVVDSNVNYYTANDLILHNKKLLINYINTETYDLNHYHYNQYKGSLNWIDLDILETTITISNIISGYIYKLYIVGVSELSEYNVLLDIPDITRIIGSININIKPGEAFIIEYILKNDVLIIDQKVVN